jgi:hypothetical protein
MHLAQDRDQFEGAIVNTIVNLKVPQNAGIFLD